MSAGVPIIDLRSSEIKARHYFRRSPLRREFADCFARSVALVAHPVRCRRLGELPAELLREIALIVKATGDGDLGDAPVAGRQRLGRRVDAHPQYILHRGHLIKPLEAAVELAYRRCASSASRATSIGWS